MVSRLHPSSWLAATRPGSSSDRRASTTSLVRATTAAMVGPSSKSATLHPRVPRVGPRRGNRTTIGPDGHRLPPKLRTPAYGPEAPATFPCSGPPVPLNVARRSLSYNAPVLTTCIEACQNVRGTAMGTIPTSGAGRASFNRRHFLEGALALGAGAVAAGCGSSSTVGKASLTAPAGSDLGAVEHVVFLMQEKRSFDHYFGTYRGVNGFDTHTADFKQAWPVGRN